MSELLSITSSVANVEEVNYLLVILREGTVLYNKYKEELSNAQRNLSSAWVKLKSSCSRSDDLSSFSSLLGYGEDTDALNDYIVDNTSSISSISSLLSCLIGGSPKKDLLSFKEYYGEDDDFFEGGFTPSSTYTSLVSLSDNSSSLTTNWYLINLEVGYSVSHGEEGYVPDEVDVQVSLVPYEVGVSYVELIGVHKELVNLPDTQNLLRSLRATRSTLLSLLKGIYEERLIELADSLVACYVSSTSDLHKTFGSYIVDTLKSDYVSTYFELKGLRGIKDTGSIWVSDIETSLNSLTTIEDFYALLPTLVDSSYLTVKFKTNRGDKISVKLYADGTIVPVFKRGSGAYAVIARLENNPRLELPKHVIEEAYSNSRADIISSMVSLAKTGRNTSKFSYKQPSAYATYLQNKYSSIFYVGFEHISSWSKYKLEKIR